MPLSSMEEDLKDPLLLTIVQATGTKAPSLPSSSSSSSASPLHPLPDAAATTTNLHRSRTAPALLILSDLVNTHQDPTFAPSHLFLRSIALLLLYLAAGIAVYVLGRDHFSSHDTLPLVDALYFSVVTMCTIGYGDITPTSPVSKLFSVAFVLVGFGFVDILLSATLSHLLNLQQQFVLVAMKAKTVNYIFDAKKGRVRIRLKVGLAIMSVVICVGVGACVLRFVERLGWLDSFYIAVISVTTVGYGDRAFKTMGGRLFASVWLLFSTMAVARAFVYLAEARLDKRHRRIAKWVLGKEMSVEEFLAAHINDSVSLSKSEFILYKLKEMGNISEKDIAQICSQFRKLDVGNCGKIKINGLLATHPPS